MLEYVHPLSGGYILRNEQSPSNMLTKREVIISIPYQVWEIYIDSTGDLQFHCLTPSIFNRSYTVSFPRPILYFYEYKRGYYAVTDDTKVYFVEGIGDPCALVSKYYSTFDFCYQYLKDPTWRLLYPHLQATLAALKEKIWIRT